MNSSNGLSRIIVIVIVLTITIAMFIRKGCMRTLQGGYKSSYFDVNLREDSIAFSYDGVVFSGSLRGKDFRQLDLKGAAVTILPDGSIVTANAETLPTRLYGYGPASGWIFNLSSEEELWSPAASLTNNVVFCDASTPPEPNGETKVGIVSVGPNITKQEIVPKKFSNIWLTPGCEINDWIFFVAAEENHNPRQIWKSKKDGSTFQKVTSASEPSYVTTCPSSNVIAYTTLDEENYIWSIYIADVDGLNVRKIYQTGAYVTQIRFLKDGNSLLVVQDTTRDEPELIEIDSKSGKSKILRSLKAVI